ncbi:ribose-phosphate diphosphokinase [Aquibium sp. A9E412]|uniref:ribose-phosphate diphosphokinase n=1 Tax=Aquibium sp. A9E412 TaxID=2976767 RepID=UPI0025B03614|nr:ribose-phosphate diphosphokinase [Aquibium sp. A9E412]MDN2568307.1 ribose-phosphate diphosphokinase [Aquibium sp. A9E412]
MKLFALDGSQTLGAAVARVLWTTLAPHEERDFEGGEHKARPMTGVRGEDVYVLHSLEGTLEQSANDKLCRLLFFLAACRDNGAASVTAVVPYLAYSRKDRQTKTRDPVTTRYVAQLFEAIGTDRVVTLDVHNIAAFQNAFRCQTVHLDTRRLFCREIAALAGDLPVTVFSPDGGGVKRAQLLKEAYEAETGAAAGFGFAEKRRSGGVVSGELFAGAVEDSAVFIVDDMIGSGGTMLRAARACRARGAAAVHALATHGLFDAGAEALLAGGEIDSVTVTDSVARARQEAEARADERLRIAEAAPLIGEAVRLLAEGGSISDLLHTPG